MTPDVFVSYASEDRDQVHALVAALEQVGLRVWWDRAIGAGSAFDREIEQALDSARCVMVVWTANSVESDWVRAEAYEGLNRGVLLPVSIGKVRPPLAFRQTQTIDVEAGTDALIAALRRLVPVVDAATVVTPKIRYATTPDGVKLAYVLQGRGPPLVRVLSWITSCTLELSDQSVLTHDLREHFRILTYDGRGAGMSDRGVFGWTLAQRLLDLETVIDASGIGERFALMGISEGCRTALAYTAAHPERVSHLVLHGGAIPEFEPRSNAVELARWFFEFLGAHWGTNVPIARRMICAIWSQTASEEEQIAYMKQMRDSMTPDVAARYAQSILEQNNDVEVSQRFWEAARNVTTPTLIVHSLRDPVVAYALAERLARVMPNAELLPLTIAEHGTGLSRELDRIQARETRRFVLGE